MRIGLISDTHGWVGPDVIEHIKDCDEIWHAGDIGDMKTAEIIERVGPPIRMVWGNIDDHDVRRAFTKDLIWEIDGLKIFMTHIGGYPGRYSRTAFSTIEREKPDLFICGHSHILKVMKDPNRNLLHMNPGACGYKGFHKFRTLLLFEIINGKVTNLNAVELGLRGKTLI